MDKEDKAKLENILILEAKYAKIDSELKELQEDLKKLEEKVKNI